MIEGSYDLRANAKIHLTLARDPRTWHKETEREKRGVSLSKTLKDFLSSDADETDLLKCRNG